MLNFMLLLPLLLLLLPTYAHANVVNEELLQWVSERNAAEPHATYTVTSESIAIHDSLRLHHGGGYTPPTAEQMIVDAQQSQLLLSDAVASSIDWRKHGAVAPVQQQHPFGTCWAMAMTAVSEGIMVVQGKQKLQKLSEQATISCVPSTYCGSNSNRLWSWLLKTTGGRLVVEDDYAYNRTCNFFRERQLAPDGTEDGYKETCNLPGPPPYAPCPPCSGITRRDGTPPCAKEKIDPKAATYSNAQVKGWGFVAIGSDGDSTNIVAALNKYGPAQIAIDASCLTGYSSGVISNCTTTQVDHAVTIVGAETDASSGINYFIVKNSWNTTFGEEGFFRVARDTNPPQMGIAGAYFGCFEEGCKITQ